MGGGCAWRPRGAKEAHHFLPDLELEALKLAADATVKGGAERPVSSAIDAIQDGINDLKAQLEKSANFVAEAIKAAFFTRTKSLLGIVEDHENMNETEETTQRDEHLRRYGGRLLGGSECDRAKAACAQETLVRQATVLDGCLDGGQYLPVFYILKDELILSPVNISLTMGVTAMPFILKPGLAVASDRLPIFGRKRTPYLAGKHDPGSWQLCRC